LLVQLTDSLIVGTVAVDELPDGPYQAEESSLSLVGPELRFSVGMPLRVRLTRVDEAQGRIEFALLEARTTADASSST
jgi:ribonuclease R